MRRSREEPIAPTPVGRRYALRCLAAVAYGASVRGFAAVPFELRVIVWKPSGAIPQVLRTLEARYPTLQWSEDAVRLSRRAGAAVYLSLGPGALGAAVAADLDGPLVSLFTSSEAYRRLTETLPPARAQRMAAIYAEASPLHQLQLIRRIYQRRVTVGLLLSPLTAHLEPVVRDDARTVGLDIDVRLANAGDALRSLARLSSVNVLLAIPDSSIYTTESLRTILEATYRRGLPVVGFSPAMVSAGTMATAYSSIDDTLAHAYEVIDMASRGAKAKAQYPAYWGVTINDNVARSLNVAIHDDVRTLGRRPP